MADSKFIKAFNQGHAQFQKDKGEWFGINGSSKQFKAIEIADLTAQQIAASGGKYGERHVNMEVYKADIELAAGALEEGKIIIVRGKRLRIDIMTDAGDNRKTLIAGPSGVKLS